MRTAKEYKSFRKTKFTDDVYIFDWVGNNLPSPNTGLCITDLDLVLYNWKSKALMIIEVKRKNAKCKRYQRYLYKMLKKSIQHGIDELYPDFTFLGVHLLQFENTTFEDGKVYFDKKQVTEQELIEILSI